MDINKHNGDNPFASIQYQPLIPSIITPNDDHLVSNIKLPDISFSGISEKRETIITDVRINDIQFNELKMRLNNYPRDIYNMTSRSDQLNIDSTVKDLIQFFVE